MTEDPKPDLVSLREIEKVLVGHDGSLSKDLRALLAVARAARKWADAEHGSEEALYVALERVRP